MKSFALTCAACLVLLSPPPPVAAADPPGAVTTLAITTGRWTAAAVFSAPTGATSYEVRYWDGSMNEPGWSGYYFGASGFCTENTQVCVQIADLDDCHTCYWAVRVHGSGGWSGLSNQPAAGTKCPPSSQVVGCDD